MEHASVQPIVSVCIPCYNGEQFISSTLESVVNQSFTDMEIVVVDDKSSDGTVSTIERFKDHRIRLIQNDQNLGLGQNWNKALSCVRGKYVKLLCEDDLLHPECLSRQVTILENPANKGVALTICNRQVIDPQNNVILQRRLPLPSGSVSGPSLIRRCVRWGTNIIGEPVVGLFRQEILHRTRMCDPSNPYLIDLGLWAEILRHGDAFLDPDYLASFRISRGAASARIGRRQAGFFRKFVRSLRADPFYKITTLDVFSGYFLSLQWCFLRNLFSHSWLSQTRRHSSQNTPFSPALDTNVSARP